MTSDHALTGPGSSSMNGLVPGSDLRELTEEQREKVLASGAQFAASSPAKGVWLLISGKFAENKDDAKLAENQVRDSCIRVFGYPSQEGETDEKAIKPTKTINVLLDSRGGMLDSAFKIVMFLSRYASELNVYVPRRAKSASTLIALGADHVYLSAFGELGPLDTQILDPRNPAQHISALDCYQSVDYVREFGFSTMNRALEQLVKRAGGQIALDKLLGTASQFALGAISPMLQGVSALDFGAWGRSLKIGERYAEILLKDRNRTANKIANDLVYGYTHHPFPIDYMEASRLGLPVEVMDGSAYDGAMTVIHACDDRAFIGFISKPESDTEADKLREEEKAARRPAATGLDTSSVGGGDSTPGTLPVTQPPPSKGEETVAD